MRTTVRAILFLGCSLLGGIAAAQEPPGPTPGAEEGAPAPGEDAPPPFAAPMEPPPAPPPPAPPLPSPPPPEESHPIASTRSLENISLLSGSVRALSQNALLLPRGDLEVGGEMTFLTSSFGPAGSRALAFTDVGLVLTNVRYSFGPVELAAAVDFLVKHPSHMSEWVPQAGSLTTRVALGEQQALSLHLAGGPLLAGLGIWEGAELAIQAKRTAHDTIVFEGALGGDFMHLNFARPTGQVFWFGEVAVGAKTTLRTPHPAFATWVEAGLHIPVAKNPDRDTPDPAGYLDPRTRLDFSVGAAYLLAERWNLYARFTVVDRGDRENPESMLPILRGGFDQQHVTLGLAYRWELGRTVEGAK